MSSWLPDLEGEAQKQLQQGGEGSPDTSDKGEQSEVSMKKSCCGYSKQPGEGLLCSQQVLSAHSALPQCGGSSQRAPAPVS